MIRSSIAVSGLFLVVFVIIHLVGLLPAVLAPEQFEAYATALHSSPWLPGVEIVLLIIVVVHTCFTTAKAIGNQKSGNIASLRSRRRSILGSLASRNKALAGVTTLVFLVIHLQQLRWPRPAVGEEAATLIQVLQQPWNIVLYGAAAVAIALHLLHGAEAAHRSMGWLTSTNKVTLGVGSGVLAALVGGGYLGISLFLALEGVR